MGKDRAREQKKKRDKAKEAREKEKEKRHCIVARNTTCPNAYTEKRRRRRSARSSKSATKNDQLSAPQEFGETTGRWRATRAENHGAHPRRGIRKRVNARSKAVAGTYLTTRRRNPQLGPLCRNEISALKNMSKPAIPQRVESRNSRSIWSHRIYMYISYY